MNKRTILVVFAVTAIAASVVCSLSGTCAEPTQILKQLDPVAIELDPAVIDPIPDPNIVPSQDPKSVYLQLVKQKLELLNPEELAQETAVLQKELLELQAAKKLIEAKQTLKQLIDQFPETQAAESAREILKSGNHPRSQPANRNDGFDNPFEKPENPKRSAPKAGNRVPSAPSSLNFGDPFGKETNPG